MKHQKESDLTWPQVLNWATVDGQQQQQQQKRKKKKKKAEANKTTTGKEDGLILGINAQS